MILKGLHCVIFLVLNCAVFLVLGIHIYIVTNIGELCEFYTVIHWCVINFLSNSRE
jgi:hypothetical protein